MALELFAIIMAGWFERDGWKIKAFTLRKIKYKVYSYINLVLFDYNGTIKTVMKCSINLFAIELEQ